MRLFVQQNPEDTLQQIIKHLKKHGELMDFQIAQDMGLPLQEVSAALACLAASNEVVMCYVMRYQGERKIEGYACRASGYIPPASPGRKPKNA
jgi:hypothetical protein